MAARIRSVKPEFFNHELLNDLEQEHPALRPMLVFAGLWCHCDKQGVFRWKPRTLKTYILPHVQYDIEKTLALLAQHDLVRGPYEVGGETYAVIPTFLQHQRITGSEGVNPSKFPPPPSDLAPREQSGHTEDTPETQPGQEKDHGKGKEGKGRSSVSADADVTVELPNWLPPTAWQEYAQHRKDKRAKLTKLSAAKSLLTLADLRNRGHDPVKVIEQSIAQGWTGLFPLKDRPQRNERTVPKGFS